MNNIGPGGPEAGRQGATPEGRSGNKRKPWKTREDHQRKPRNTTENHGRPQRKIAEITDNHGRRPRRPRKTTGDNGTTQDRERLQKIIADRKRRRGKPLKKHGRPPWETTADHGKPRESTIGHHAKPREATDLNDFQCFLLSPVVVSHVCPLSFAVSRRPVGLPWFSVVFCCFPLFFAVSRCGLPWFCLVFRCAMLRSPVVFRRLSRSPMVPWSPRFSAVFRGLPRSHAASRGLL